MQDYQIMLGYVTQLFFENIHQGRPTKFESLTTFQSEDRPQNAPGAIIYSIPLEHYRSQKGSSGTVR